MQDWTQIPGSYDKATKPFLCACVTKHCSIAATLFDGVWEILYLTSFKSHLFRKSTQSHHLFALAHFSEEILGPSDAMSCLQEQLRKTLQKKQEQLESKEKVPDEFWKKMKCIAFTA